MIPAAGREAWREVAVEPAAEAPPEFLPPDAFEDLLGTRVWRAPEPAEPPRRRMARGTPPQVERQPEPQPAPRVERQPARRTETALASLHEAAIRAPLARGKVQAKPPRPRRTEPALDAQATIERPPPLDPRLLPPLPSPIPELRAPASHRPSAAHRVASPPVYQAPSPPPYLVPSPPAFQAPPPALRPAIFDHQPRRPSTAAAVEPPRFSRFSRPRTREGRVVHLSIAAAVVAAGIVLAAGYQIWAAQQPHGKATAALPDQRRAEDEDPVKKIALSAQESQRVVHPTSARYRDLWRSTLWYHPLTDEVFLPENVTRKFGAARHGDRPRECGRGHCGVDIGFFGLSVRAAQDGLVEVVQRHARDNAGKYVRILHDNGFVSYYIHLHRIRDDLEVGMRVKGGEPIGIVGKTGIKRSRPHLHFQLAYRDGNEQIFIDPEPLLRRSVSSDDETVATPGTRDEHAQHVTRAPSPAL